MVFSSQVFLFVFLPVTVIGYYLLHKPLRNYFLLFMSLVFYAWGEPKFIFVLILSVIANYLFALLIDHFRKVLWIKKGVLVLSVLANCSLFFVYKYLGFVVNNINMIFKKELSVPEIALPIGISFFTFQAMSYVFDVYNEKGQVQKNPFNVGLYITLFPQLIAGPIVRYQTVAEEIKSRKESLQDFCEGFTRFLVGLSKKVLLANTLAMTADRFFNVGDYASLTTAGAWIGSICYTLQIFFDFSGYSDMAIGLGRMFGFHFPENFNYPYAASSVTDFWRRWHITLSSWFRDYIYIPLGGNRVSKGRNILNLFVVWILTGIWHGASWNFVCWGLFYFILLVFEKQTGILKHLRGIGAVIYRIFTLLCVNFAWVLFRATDLKGALRYVKSMFGGFHTSFMDDKTLVTLMDILPVAGIAILLSIPWKSLVGAKLQKMPVLWKVLQMAGVVLLCFCTLVCAGACLTGAYNPFIYFNF